MSKRIIMLTFLGMIIVLFCLVGCNNNSEPIITKSSSSCEKIINTELKESCFTKLARINVDSIKKHVESGFMKSGQKVIIPLIKKEMTKGDSDFFAIGIKSENVSSELFDVLVSCNSAYTKNNDLICDVNRNVSCDICQDWVYPISNIKISSNESKIENIFVKVPKGLDDNIRAGTYVFDVQVMNGGKTYDRVIYKFYIILK